MDWRRVIASLSPQQRSALDLPSAFQRFRNAGGADDADAFRVWLVEQHPQVFDTSLQTVTMAPVEVSVVLPARFAVGVPAATAADARTLHEENTVADERTQRMPAAFRSAATAQDHLRTVQAGVAGATKADTADAARTLADHETPTIASPRRAEGSASGAASGAAGAPPPPPQPSSAFDGIHYILVGVAGSGGMGTVHIAKDTELLRRVAFKQLHAGASAIVSARTRFLREAQITAQLDHPNIVPVHALEVAPDGMPAYTMKLVEGRNFSALLEQARKAFEDGGRPNETVALAARIEHFLKVCDAIAYAHDKGVIHRDLKPANLMLGRHNEVYVMDWGLCRAMYDPDDTPAENSAIAVSAEISGSASDTQMGEVVGTPKYMSPEQASGKIDQIDARSDQCSLGLILHELVTLNPPNEGRNAYEALVNAAAGKRRPITHAFLGRRGVAPDLAAIIQRATAQAPDHRYTSVGELAADLRRYLRGDAVLARPDDLWQRTQRAIGRHRQRVLTGILALIAVAAIAIGGLLWQNQQVFRSERLREQRLLQLRDSVADVSSYVQVRMVQLESVVVNLADSVSQITDFGHPVDIRYYLARDFRDPATAPPDLALNKTNGSHFSLASPVWTLPPNMSESEAAPTLRKLAALQAFHRDIFHRSAVMIRNKLVDIYAPVAEIAGDDAEDNPLAAIVIGLSSGIFSLYPGWDGMPDNYDPRQQPWYKVADGKRSPQWSDPYFSQTTKREELSVSVPMYMRDGRFLGVASALLNPDLMVRSLLDIKGIAGVDDVVLIDATGHILASLNHTLNSGNDVMIEVFPVPELLKRQKLHETGIFETTLRGKPVVLAFDEVEPLGWNIVAIAEPAQLLQATP